MCLKLRHNSYMYLICLIWGTSEAQNMLPLILSNFSYLCLQYSIQLELVQKFENFHFSFKVFRGVGVIFYTILLFFITKFLQYSSLLEFYDNWVISFPKIYNMPLKLRGILCLPLMPLIWGASEGQKVLPSIYPIFQAYSRYCNWIWIKFEN